MKSIYQSPLRVYLSIALLAAIGIFSAFKLPVSLFPNSVKPTMWVGIDYGHLTPESFSKAYGMQVEWQFKSIRTSEVKVEKVEADYHSRKASYFVHFDWGSQPELAKRETELAIHSISGIFPKEIRDSIQVWPHRSNTGFYAGSFSSPVRSPSELYDVLQPIFGSKLASLDEADEAVLYNPMQKEVTIELDPEIIASLGLVPRQIETAIRRAVTSKGGGSLTLGTRKMSIQMRQEASDVEEIKRIRLQTPSGKMVHLGEIASIDLGNPTMKARLFKTNGADTLMLWATPKPGSNIKRMADKINSMVESALPNIPKDIQFQKVVDPSSFIRSAITNVGQEVVLAAGLAVLVLFLFIGNVRNVFTAAIEIPISLVLAFALMKLTGLNLNLISLAGLALSAGMNVDASVVVIENIFRHLEEKKKKGETLASQDYLELITRAVREIRFPVIAATISSLVVFAPLMLTSGLGYAILGDLAKAVVYSHGFSAIIALVLVPTIRLQLMKRGDLKLARPPIHGFLKKLESAYANTLDRFLGSTFLKLSSVVALIATLAGLFIYVLPKIPKEIVGKPNTDLVWIGVRTKGNTLIQQIETQASEVEERLLRKYRDQVDYTFANIRRPNRAWIMLRIFDRTQMEPFVKELEEELVDTAEMRFEISPWNPSELRIPNPPQLRIAIRSGDPKERAIIADQLREELEAAKLYHRVWTDPNANFKQDVVLRPRREQWNALQNQGISVQPSDLADLARIATQGKIVDWITLKDKSTAIVLRFPKNRVRSVEDVGAIPVGIGARLVPLKALADISLEEVSPELLRRDQQALFEIGARTKDDEKHKAKALEQKVRELLPKWKKKHNIKEFEGGPGIVFEDPAIELTEAIEELTFALGLSVLLVFFTLIFQFGSLASALLVMIAIPLGFIGVLSALYIFNSTLSLNAILGLILLNGIAVANSILLVDVMQKLYRSGLSPRKAAVEAGRRRLRPILITSLTTILGMLPIALGLGEGGKILQPLGIAVSCGLWFSMMTTLFIVPMMQFVFLKWFGKRKEPMQAEAPLPPSRPSNEKFQNPSPAGAFSESTFSVGLKVHSQVTPPPFRHRGIRR